jgi:hypothetical protein
VIPAVIHRAELPIDDRPHGIDLTGDILHAAVRRPGAVDIWYQANPDGAEPMRRSFQVVGTGQLIPAHLGFYVTHKGTAVSPDGVLVWHVLENHCPHKDGDREAPEEIPGLCPGCGVRITTHPTAGWIPA